MENLPVKTTTILFAVVVLAVTYSPMIAYR
jgi:hypothetical protein